jgi:hypothetical protein
MTTDLEQRLREALHEDAARAHLFNSDGPPAPDAPFLTDGQDARRRPRWIAVAAVAAVLALVASLTLLNDDQKVDTVPPVRMPLPLVDVVPSVGTIASGSGCPFGIAGGPVDMQPGSVAGRFATVGGQGVAHILLGAQLAEVHVPGLERSGDEGWREEPIELDRGPAMVWLDGPVSASRDGAGDLPFVQARYFPVGDEPCSSFTVTVDGGTEDENRQVAVDLAARVLLPAELEGLDLPGTDGGPVAGLALTGTEWTIVDPQTSVALGMSFTDTTVSWDDGCATMAADYEVDRQEGDLILTNRSSTGPACAPPTNRFEGRSPSQQIDAVMGADRIAMNLVEGRLYLGDYPDGEFIALAPPAPSADQGPALPEPGAQQPGDLTGAEEQVRAAFTGLYDAAVPREDRAQFVDRPEVWLPLNKALFESEYGAVLHDLHAVVDSVVFTSPTHAAVRFQLLASDERVPGNYTIGDAVLVDGRWVVDVTTPCFTAEATGFACDFTP